MFAPVLLYAQKEATKENGPRAKLVSSPAYTTAFSASVDNIVNTTVLKLKIPSVTVAVAHHGVLLHSGAYGLEHTRPDVTPTMTTVYLLDSLTKQFTAAAIMLLVQDGKIDVDKPVKTYVPYAPATWDKITLRHLLTHTSGLPHDPKWGYPPIKSQDENPDRLLKHYVFNQELKTAPGRTYAYSNTGYATLGAIVGKVSGMRYTEFVRTRIFEAAGMSSTGFDYTGGWVKEGARGYSYDSGKNEWTPVNDFYQPLAAGAVQSNVVDLAKWDAALNGDAILSGKSKAAMWADGKLEGGKPIGYGFGWVPSDLNGGEVVWHNGGGWGFNSAFYRYLQSGLTVIVLTNLAEEAKGETHADALARAIAAAYSPELSLDASDTSATLGSPGAAPKGNDTKASGKKGK